MIRLATENDSAGILKVFTPIVECTAISFATEVPTVEEYRLKIRETLREFPWLVQEDKGEILGYAYASKHRTLGAYRWSVELSLYVAESSRRRGVGRSLYGALIPLLKRQGYYNAYAGITLPNVASVALHEHFGFRPFCVFRSIGYKLGKWHDVGWWELSIQRKYPPHPSEPMRSSEAL